MSPVSLPVLCQWSPATHFTFYPDSITSNNNQYHQNHHRLCKHATPAPAGVTSTQSLHHRAVSPWHITASSPHHHHITIVTLSALHHPICQDSCSHNCRVTGPRCGTLLSVGTPLSGGRVSPSSTSTHWCRPPHRHHTLLFLSVVCSVCSMNGYVVVFSLITAAMS